MILLYSPLVGANFATPGRFPFIGSMVFATGGNGQHFSWGFFTLLPFNPYPINPSRIKAKSWMGTKTQWKGHKPVRWTEELVLTFEICKLDKNMLTVIVIESLTIVKMIVLFNKLLFLLSKFSY